MFGIGFGEMLIIAIILLIAVGPKELPKLMKTVGKGVREVRKASDDLRKAVGIDELLNDDDLRNPMRAEPARRPLNANDLEREMPREGVDVVHARQAAEEKARVAQTVLALPENSEKAGETTPEEGA
jgi:Tat protein translocase TatB subunit